MDTEHRALSHAGLAQAGYAMTIWWLQDLSPRKEILSVGTVMRPLDYP